MNKRIATAILTVTAVAIFYSKSHAFVDMGRAPGLAGAFQGVQAFEYKLSISTIAPTTSDWVIVPAGVSWISVTVTPCATGCGAKVQTTTDPVYNVKTDTLNSVSYTDWVDGVVVTTTADVAKPVTAMRLVLTSTGTANINNSSGTATMTMRAQ